MTMLDAGELAEKIQTRFGLSVSSGSEEIDGGTFVVLRPSTSNTRMVSASLLLERLV